MKRILIIILVITSFLQTEGKCRFSEEPRRVQNFEGGIMLGAGIPISRYEGYAPKFGMGEIDIEVRYNIKYTGWDTGVLYFLQTQNWEKPDGRTYDLQYGGFLAVADYNFRQGRKVNPYAGLALGLDVDNRRFLAVPRFGVELLYHIRLEAKLFINSNNRHIFMLSAGFAIGGRPKKPRGCY